jgi:hypothetical protein
MHPNLVRIGRAPGIYQETDRWGCETGTYSAVLPFEVTEEMWQKLQVYQAERVLPEDVQAWIRFQPVGVPEAELHALAAGRPSGAPEYIKRFVADTRATLGIFDGIPRTLHQFNAWSPHHREPVRQVVAAFTPTLRRWTWVDTWIRYQWSRIQAAVRSRTESDPL